MKRVNENWFECEDGHVTVGGSKKTTCDASLWQLNYVKGKRKNWTIEKTISGKKCGKHIVETGEIPENISYSTVWDHRTAHAFSIGQVMDSDLIIGLQMEFTKLWKKVNGTNE